MLPSDEALLDNPVYAALSGVHAQFAEVSGRARRYPVDVAPFVALPSQPSAQDWQDAAGLFVPGTYAAVLHDGAQIPPGWKVIRAFDAVHIPRVRATLALALWMRGPLPVREPSRARDGPTVVLYGWGRGMRRALSVLMAGVMGALVAAAPAVARAGGGSSGFGGSGRGGGGFGGHGHSIFVPVGGGAGVFLFILLLVIVFLVLPRLLRWWHGQRTAGVTARRRVGQRQRRVELAAAEAAEDDATFAPERVRSEARRLFIDIQAAWDAGDRVRLRRLVAPELLAEWERRLDDFERRGWRNRVQPLDEPSVEYVGLSNRSDDRADRVVVRIEARLRDYVEDAYGQRVGRVDTAGEISHVREFWTLGKRDGHWILQSIEQGAEGSHQLTDRIVATPWADEQALRDEALVEGAVQDAVPHGTKLAEVADLDFAGDARAAALDLSLADGRFAPDVLEVAARRAVAAWVDAVDGDDSPLLALADPAAARELLHPGDPSQRTRLVVRGLEVRRISIVSLDAASEPATMTIDVALAGRRYLEDRDTAAVVAGSPTRETTFTERWTLALNGPAEQPWRIAAVGTPAARR